jgi:hypothetical protein
MQTGNPRLTVQLLITGLLLVAPPLAGQPCPSVRVRFSADLAPDVDVSLPFRCRDVSGQSFTLTFLDRDGSVQVQFCFCNSYLIFSKLRRFRRCSPVR